MNTVEPLFKYHLKSQEKVVLKDGGRGTFTWEFEGYIYIEIVHLHGDRKGTFTWE